MSQVMNTKTTLHPLTSAIRHMANILGDLGFTVAEGPEIETVEFNFDRLNVPKDHPSRDMQDTFYINDDLVLRTHTSSVQARYLKEKGVPVKIIVPGRTYRNEATDATHEAQFNQIEGLYIDQDVNMGNLKWTMEYLFKNYFDTDDLEVRLRPSFFPFVEPGVEVDIKIDGETVPKQLRNKWIEVMGAGMVHPYVLKAAGIADDKYTGFAFGGGIERFAMLKHAIEDIRLFNSADLRFLMQFTV